MILYWRVNHCSQMVVVKCNKFYMINKFMIRAPNLLFVVIRWLIRTDYVIIVVIALLRSYLVELL